MDMRTRIYMYIYTYIVSKKHDRGGGIRWYSEPTSTSAPDLKININYEGFWELSNALKIHKYIYTYIHSCMHVGKSTHKHIYIHTYTHTHTRTHARTHTYTHTHTHARTHAHQHTPMHSRTFTHRHECVDLPSYRDYRDPQKWQPATDRSTPCRKSAWV